MLLNNRLPSLRELNLGRALVDAQSLVSIISQYQATLRDLSLIDVRFTQAGAWHIIATNIGQKVELRRVRVGRTIESFRGADSVRAFRCELDRICCSFMKGRPKEIWQPQWPRHIGTRWVEMSDGSRNSRLYAIEASRRT